MLQYKHEAYKHEHEVRLIVPQQKVGWERNPIAIRLPIRDIDQLIKGVVVAPEATTEFVEVVKGLCARYGVTAPVDQSQLAKVPV